MKLQGLQWLRVPPFSLPRTLSPQRMAVEFERNAVWNSAMKRLGWGGHDASLTQAHVPVLNPPKLNLSTGLGFGKPLCSEGKRRKTPKAPPAFLKKSLALSLSLSLSAPYGTDTFSKLWSLSQWGVSNGKVCRERGKSWSILKRNPTALY